MGSKSVYIDRMETTVEQLEEQAMALPVKDRLRLAHTMLKSAPVKPEVTQDEYEAELVRRIEAVKAGDHSGLTLEEFEEKNRERLKK